MMKKIKHDHSLTDILKFSIFSIIMMAPIFAILFEVLFVIYNRQLVVTSAEKNLFYDAVANLKTQSMFNWTSTTSIYSAISGMTTGMGITESAIPMLLAYWSLMTAIYVVMDIIIVLFTKMTHMLMKAD